MSEKVKKFGNDANNQIFIRLNIDKLQKLEQIFNRNYVVQVGVLGVKAAGRLDIKKEDVGEKKKVPVARDSSLSNADIGLIHEKGSPKRKIPRRSFLEMPLTTKMPGKISAVKAVLMQAVDSLNIELAYQKLAKIAEGIVLQAFPTSGYGTWPNKSSGTVQIAGYGKQTIRGGGPSHLIDTGQLRQSIATRVVTK